jgi:hypothetical protein
VNTDKALSWVRRRKDAAPAPWWKPIRWVANRVSRATGSKPSGPQAVASSWWARAAAAVAATTAGTVVLIRRRRQNGDDASETAGGATESEVGSEERTEP